MSETIKIKSAHPESQGPYVIIEAADFDETKHQLFDEAEPNAEQAADAPRRRGRPPKTEG